MIDLEGRVTGAVWTSTDGTAAALRLPHPVSGQLREPVRTATHRGPTVTRSEDALASHRMGLRHGDPCLGVRLEDRQDGGAQLDPVRGRCEVHGGRLGGLGLGLRCQCQPVLARHDGIAGEGADTQRGYQLVERMCDEGRTALERSVQGG